QQNFVMTADAPRFATRILATANPDSVIFSFGVENPTNRHEAHMHTRIAMPLSAVKSFADLLNRIISDVEMKKSLQGMDYSHIPSDA
ncbi:MAG TPA: hypothetical protein PKL83_03170, partial [bacterium]|nr:hypothetical protein [bacterium]